MKFLGRNSLYFQTVAALLVAVYVALRWSALPTLSRTVCLFYIALVMHLWEESRYPGGFTDMITEKLHFTQDDPYFGEFVLGIAAVLVGLVPVFFSHVTWLVMTVMILGVMEFVVHVAAIKLFDLGRPYSPGLITATFSMLPISAYSIYYAVHHGLMKFSLWPLSIAYLFASMALGQQIVVRASGMKYSTFLGNVRAAIFRRKADMA